MKNIVKVIETNISYSKTNNNIYDHQSRVIEIDNWDFYTKIFNEYNPNYYPQQFNSFIGNLWGGCMPKNAKISYLDYDSFHLQCDYVDFMGGKRTKLAYLVD